MMFGFQGWYLPENCKHAWSGFPKYCTLEDECDKKRLCSFTRCMACAFCLVPGQSEELCRRKTKVGNVEPDC